MFDAVCSLCVSFRSQTQNENENKNYLDQQNRISAKKMKTENYLQNKNNIVNNTTCWNYNNNISEIEGNQKVNQAPTATKAK